MERERERERESRRHGHLIGHAKLSSWSRKVGLLAAAQLFIAPKKVVPKSLQHPLFLNLHISYRLSN
jgi:hypothetical protein